MPRKSFTRIISSETGGAGFSGGTTLKTGASAAGASGLFSGFIGVFCELVFTVIQQTPQSQFLYKQIWRWSLGAAFGWVPGRKNDQKRQNRSSLMKNGRFWPREESWRVSFGVRDCLLLHARWHRGGLTALAVQLSANDKNAGPSRHTRC